MLSATMYIMSTTESTRLPDRSVASRAWRRTLSLAAQTPADKRSLPTYDRSGLLVRQCSAPARQPAGAGKGDLRSTDIGDPDYFHKVVDCQWACPAHTPVPEYIRLIAAGRYTDAYLVNWESNVFPGILGRTCDRPCEPACRRGRVEEAQAAKPEPVAICRLKRVAADFKDDIARAPAAARPQRERQAHRLHRRRARPRSRSPAIWRRSATRSSCSTATRKAGGMIRSQIPRFRLPEEVIDEETGYVLKLGVEFRGGTRIESMRALLAERLGRRLRRLRRAARPRPVDPGPHRGGGPHPHRHRLAVVGVVRPRHDRSAGASSSSAAATPRWTAAAARSVSAAATSRSSSARRSRR